MPTATVTSKGQITIPAKVRKALGLKPGVRIDFYETADGEYTLRPKSSSIIDMRGCLAYDGPPVTIEEMNQAILDHAAAADTATMSASIGNQPDGEAA
jgi:AbrB family looped-hinge helix DNA binding protein